MGRIGFWQLLLDPKVSGWEARAINGAYDQADLADQQAQANAFSIGEAQKRISQLGREVVMLRAAMTVLVNTLRDTNVIDPRLLDARLEAALEEATAPPEPAKPAAPKHAAAGPMAAPISAPVTCLRCRQQVPASSTNMTADGPVCDHCPPH